VPSWCQLEAELDKGAWDIAMPEEALVFDVDAERKWSEAAATGCWTREAGRHS
jgi:putative AlgH/UPF0301 family transcriptional regulator